MVRLYAGDTIGPSSEYQEHLQKEHDGSKWGSTGGRYSGADVLQLLEERPYIQTVLDFGAGKGSLEVFIKEKLGRDIVWTNYDPGVLEYNRIPQKQFDLVTTTDVLEHVEPENLVQTLQVLEALTATVLFNDIACYPTGKIFMEGPYKGLDMHLIVEEPSWWRKQFKEAIALHEHIYEHRDKASNRGPRTRCVMIHERV